MLKKVNLLILSILLATSAFSKEFPKMYDPPVKFSKLDEKRLKDATELFNKGLAMWNELTNRYNPEDADTYQKDSIYNKDAYPILIKIGNIFFEANKRKFEVYRDNCTNFWTTHRYDSPSGLEGAKKFQKEADVYFEKADLNKRVADNYINQYVSTYNRYFEAISLEIIGVKKEARALQIYRDWPVHYAYEWDEDVEANLFAEKPKEPEVVVVDTTPEPVIPPHDSTIIYYSVQIAAHTIPMTESYIRGNIYSGPMFINEIWEEGWYKYLIGRYKNVEDAIKLLRESHVEKAFVVGYRNGKRVPLKELTTETIPPN